MLVITNQQRENLSILRDLTPEKLFELCTEAVEFTSSKNTSKSKAAVQLNKYDIAIESDAIEDVLEALICLLVGPLKYNISATEFHEVVSGIGFSKDQTDTLWKHAKTKNSFLSQIVHQYRIQQYRFAYLEWRLEAKVCSRSFYNHASPNIIIKLHLHSAGLPENRETINSNSPASQKNQKQILIQTDLNALRHIIGVLEQALILSKTSKLNLAT